MRFYKLGMRRLKLRPGWVEKSRQGISLGWTSLLDNSCRLDKCRLLKTNRLWGSSYPQDKELEQSCQLKDKRCRADTAWAMTIRCWGSSCLQDNRSLPTRTTNRTSDNTFQENKE